MKPFIKWVGGKRQLLERIRTLFPNLNKINTYYEPFVGGGAVFLEFSFKNAVIADTNYELITTWKVIKDDLVSLENELLKHLKNHNLYGKEYFLKMRSINLSTLNDIEIAARFIYLNKTCFNGIYRVNKRNQFNVPFNNKLLINFNTLFNQKNINEISFWLKSNNIIIKNTDFEETLKDVKKGDFVFVDPPYDTDKNNFDGYSPLPFGKEGQIRLHNVLETLDAKGVKWLLTNHNTDLINSLYKNYNIRVFKVNRLLNSDSKNRINSAFEVIITNY